MAVREGRRLQTDAFAVVLLVALLAAGFAPWWARGRLFAPLDVLHQTFSPWSHDAVAVDPHNHFTSDAVTQYIVYRQFAARSFAEDGRIGWSDLTHGGRPEYANTMALYGDWTMQLHRILDFWTAWHLGIMAQLLIAALGMYVLLRSQALLPVVALTGAVAFAASTPLVFNMYHRWMLASFAWVPWLLWAMHAYRAGRRRAWPAVPVLLALALAGASLQTAAFIALVLLAVWGAWLAQATHARERVRLTAHCVAWSVLGAALAAYTLLPAVLMYVDALDLHGGRSALGYAGGWLQPVRSIVLIPLQAVPALLGSPRSLDLVKLFDGNMMYLAFFGFVLTVLALRSVFWRGTPPVARALMVVGLLVPLTPLVGALYHRVQVVFVVGGVWAASWYWQHEQRELERWWRHVLTAGAAFVALWLTASVASALAAGPLRDAVTTRVLAEAAAGGGGRLGGYTDWLSVRAARLIDELQIWHPRQLVALTAAALGIWALRQRGRLGVERASWLLLGAVVLELGALAAGWLTTVDAREYPAWTQTTDLAALTAASAGGRVHLAAHYDGAALFLPPNTLAMYGVATIQQYETVDMHGMWHAAGGAEDAATLGRLGVTHAAAPTDTVLPGGWTIVHRGETLNVWRNELALPRYAGSAAQAAQPGLADRLQNGALTLLPVTVQHATQNRRALLLTPGTATVRVAENWSEGWTYREDGGSRRPVARAADGAMLIAVEGARAGQAVHIDMEYRPSRRAAGRAVSLAAALVIAVAAAHFGRPRSGAVQVAAEEAG